MKAHRIIDAARAVAESVGARMALSRIEDIMWSPSYVEPGYSTDKECILFGNWNTLDRWNNETKSHHAVEPDSKIWQRTVEALEKVAELEWHDEWQTCSECSKAFRTQADSYGWQRSYWEVDGKQLCLECAAKNVEEVLNSFEGNDRSALTRDLGIDPNQHGYFLAQDDFENGWHGGQDADPLSIGKALRKEGIHRYLFRIDSVGQFDLNFSLFLHEEEKEKWCSGMEACLSHDEYKAKEDPAVVLDRGLRAVGKASASVPQGDGPIITKINADGTATAKRVSAQDFIEGRALD